MMCIPDIMNPYYFAMIHGAAVTLERFGYSILLEYTMHNPQKELEVLDSLKGTLWTASSSAHLTIRRL